MNTQHQAKQNQAKQIFLQLVDSAPPGEWAERLAELCQGDDELLFRVNALLRAHADPGSFLAEPAFAEARTEDCMPPLEKPGTQIGRYRLLQQIGEGGMGVVYMAEQNEPVKRRVALKIIKPGMDTRQVIARFEAERQALAMMDHPNIAKVLDAGATDSGRPFFVMELVNGVSVTRHCDDQRLNPRQRLELFMPICQAVHHAHQKGVIHRDLKPSNILVALYDGEPVPKIIDFGVAKATSQSLTQKTMFTELGQLVGTLEYMSPEQAQRNQLDVDTRSDIYSLGVVLYELLAGETPFDRQRLRTAGLDEVLRIIREEDPPKPSTKVGSSASLPSVAATRHLEPRQLSTTIRGELDWIVMKAIAKERPRRYQSASDFAADVGRFLHHETVSASPPSSAYRLRKFIRRNRASILTAALLLMALLAGLAGTTWQAILASRAAARAESEALVSRTINEFVNEDLLAQADPYLEPDRNIKLRTVLDRAAESIERRFTDQPVVKAEILSTLGRTYRGLGEYEQAEQFQRRALQLRSEALGDFHRDTVASQFYVGFALYNQGRFPEAESVLRAALSGARRVPDCGAVLPLAIRRVLAAVLLNRGSLQQAEQFSTEALRDAQQALGEDDPLTMGLLRDVASVQLKRGEYANALRTIRRALSDLRANVGEKHPSTLAAERQLADILQMLGEYDTAEQHYQTVLALQKQVLGEDHPETATTLNNLAGAAAKLGRLEEALEGYQAAYDSRRRALGSDHCLTIISLNDLATGYAKLGEKEKAEELHLEVLRRLPGTLENEHPVVIANLNNVANAVAKRGEFAEADRLYRRVLAMQERVLPARHPDIFRTLGNLGINLIDLRRLDEAEKHLQDALSGRQQALGDGHPRTLWIKFHLGRALLEQGNRKQAEQIWRATLEQRRQVLPARHPEILANMRELGKLLAQRSKLKEAEQMLRECLRLQEGKTVKDPDYRRTQSHLGIVLFMKLELEESERLLREVYEATDADDPNALAARSNFVTVLMESGDYAAAEREFRDMLKTLPPEELRTQVVAHNLAVALLNQKKYAEAEPVLLKVLSTRELLLDASHPELLKTRRHLAVLYAGWSWQLATREEVRSSDDATRCRDWAERAVQFDDQNPVCYKALGAASYRCGKWQDAVDALEKADVMLDGASLEQRWFLAMAYWQLGNKHRARSELASATAAFNDLVEDETGLREALVPLRDEATALIEDNPM